MEQRSQEEAVALILADFEESLFKELAIGGLISRNPTAHKWKAPFRSMSLREAIFWRVHDLFQQSFVLHLGGHGLGARILLRSALETMAMLIYLNQITAKVLDGSLDFHAFSDKTIQLLLGSRDGSTGVTSINILTALDKCEKRYPGMKTMYERLSESAHPNFEGISAGYSQIDHANYVTTFKNRWMERHGESHLDEMMVCIEVFNHEYDDVWPELFEKLEAWIEANDAELEATKGSPTTAA